MKLLFNSYVWVTSLLLVSNLFFSSCDKVKDDPETVPIPLLASVVTHSDNGQPDFSQFYQYDNQGRVIKIDDDEGYSTTMEYSGSTIIIKDSEDGELKDLTIAQLDSKGLCTSVSLEDSNKLQTYEYDSNGYRKSANFETATVVFTSTYTVFEGNYITTISEDKSNTTNSALVKVMGSFKRASIATNQQRRYTSKIMLKSAASINITKSDYQFNKDKINTIEFENMGISFMGKQNKNPIMQETNTYTRDGEVLEPQSITYTYEYDTKNRITKQTSDDGKYTIFTYVD